MVRLFGENTMTKPKKQRLSDAQKTQEKQKLFILAATVVSVILVILFLAT